MNADVPLAGPEAMKAQVAAGFAAAADGYDADGTEFFRQVGIWLVEAAEVPAGAWVLDVGCGKGAVSLPAAHATGPRGHVTGIDLAAPMLRHAAERARHAGLTNVSFVEGDAEDPSRSFRDKLILVLFALVRVCAWHGSAYYPCQRLGA